MARKIIVRIGLNECGAVGIEIPVARRLEDLPVNAHSLAIAEVFSDRPDRLYAHNRDWLTIDIKRKIVALHEGRLNGEAVSGPYFPNKLGEAVLIAILPDAFANEPSS